MSSVNKTVGRYDPCPCGSGKKYKFCCEERDRTREKSLLMLPLPVSSEHGQDEQNSPDEIEASLPPLPRNVC